VLKVTANRKQKYYGIYGNVPHNSEGPNNSFLFIKDFETNKNRET